MRVSLTITPVLNIEAETAPRDKNKRVFEEIGISKSATEIVRESEEFTLEETKSSVHCAHSPRIRGLDHSEVEETSFYLKHSCVKGL